MGFLEVENLTYYYPDKDDYSLKNINLSVSEGEFLFLAGSSGCGKSTLLKAMAGLVPEFYGGTIGGSVSYLGRPLQGWDRRQLARHIGSIFQDPEQQIVMTTVENELAFGLENLGVSRGQMRRRVAEVISLFDLGPYRQEKTVNLSGGLKQKVALGAVLAMHPRLLLLDEPTSQLDPVAAQDILNYVQRLNAEWGLTVVLVEQRIDRCFHLADRIVIMEEGEIKLEDSPRSFGENPGNYLHFLPPVSRVFAASGFKEIPLTVKEGRKILKGLVEDDIDVSLKEDERSSPGKDVKETPILGVKGLYYGYPGRDFTLRDISFNLYPGQITAVMGENGAGKSTLLKLMCGLYKPARGRLRLRGEDVTGKPVEELAMDIGLLTQDPNDYLLSDTVMDELEYGLKKRDISDLSPAKKLLAKLHLQNLKNANPRDLSGGEKQRVALGTVLATEPSVLLLDEPTRGVDVQLKNDLVSLLQKLVSENISVMMVTHDIEFAALLAHRIMILSGGSVVALGDRNKVLADSLYYAPQVGRLFRGYDPDIMTVDEGTAFLKSCCRKVNTVSPEKGVL